MERHAMIKLIGQEWKRSQKAPVSRHLMNCVATSLLLALLCPFSLYAAEPIRGTVSLPATGAPGEAPCGPVNDVTQQAVKTAAKAISQYSRGAVPVEVLEKLIFSSGLVKADHSACQQVCIVVPGNYQVWFESTRSGNHPWWCTGRRTFIDFEWSRVLHINSRHVGKGYYLVCGTFQNWSHDQGLNASIVAYPPKMDWQWPEHCGDHAQNTASAAH